MLRVSKNNISDFSDDVLLQQYKTKGDVYYLGQLFERYTSLVYGVCLKYLKNEQDAEDAYMGIFEKLIQKARQHDVQNFKSWLHVLVKNYCLELLRKQKKHLTVSYEPELMQKELSVHPFEEAVTLEPQLDLCLQQLEVHQKACIQLFYYENKSYKDIATLRNQSLGTIRSYIQNGRRNLKICMEASGISNNE